MLDEFSSAKISRPAKPKANSEGDSAKTQPTAAPAKAEDGRRNSRDHQPENEEDEFSKQLQEGMVEMMKELEANPDMAKQFEQLMSGQFGVGGDDVAQSDAASTTNTADKDPTGGESAKSTSGSQDTESTVPPPSFQDTIRQTMDRMRDSNASASAASSKPGDPSSDDFMTAMLNEIAQSQGGANGNPEDAFSNMLLGMMEQLTNKEILYEPMKDLNGKFPAWLAEREPGKPKADLISQEDRKKYEEQQSLVKQIVGRFERPDYSDENAQDREFVVERMQKMQAAGAPPSDLVGDMGGAAEMLVRRSDSQKFRLS